YSSLYIFCLLFRFFFFHSTARSAIYTLSLHDALPILSPTGSERLPRARRRGTAERDSGSQSTTRGRRGGSGSLSGSASSPGSSRSEEHTSELQSRGHLVCRLLLEKKKKKKKQ